MLENTRVAAKDVDVNELAEKSWQEIQSAFGSGTNLAAKLTLPVKFVPAGLGLDWMRIGTDSLAFKSNQQNIFKSSQKS